MHRAALVVADCFARLKRTNFRYRQDINWMRCSLNGLAQRNRAR
jgi:hypothetical protein